MAFTIEALEEQLELIQALKKQLLQQGLPGIQKPASWRVGEVQFNFGGAGSKTYMSLSDLIAAEKEIMEMMQNLFPSEVAVTHQDAISPFGHDETTYVGEDEL